MNSLTTIRDIWTHRVAANVTRFPSIARLPNKWKVMDLALALRKQYAHEPCCDSSTDATDPHERAMDVM